MTRTTPIGRIPRFLALAAVAALIAASVATAQTNEGSFERTLKVTGQVQLAIRSGSGRIRIVPGPTDTVRISGRVRANRGWLFVDHSDRIRRIVKDPPIEQAGNAITVGRITDQGLFENISISYDVTVPPSTAVRAKAGSGGIEIGDIAGPVDANTGSGGITIGRVGSDVVASTGSGGVEVSGAASLDAHAGSGSIRADAIAGTVKASSGSGGVHITQTGKGSLDVSSSSGEVVIRGVDGPAHVSASSGGIEMEGRPGGPWNVHASSGGVTLRLPSDAAFDLDASAGSGTIESSHPITMSGRLGRHEMHGRVRGGGPIVTVRTGSGGISIR